MIGIINRARRDPDRWVVRIAYRDAKGCVTVRVISPIRWVSRYTILALCLGRQEPRQFDLRRIGAAELVPAADVVMGIEEDQGNERVRVKPTAAGAVDKRE
jgi:predicted DNA-binding transcriptional regulator YafY